MHTCIYKYIYMYTDVSTRACAKNQRKKTNRERQTNNGCSERYITLAALLAIQRAPSFPAVYPPNTPN